MTRRIRFFLVAGCLLACLVAVSVASRAQAAAAFGADAVTDIDANGLLKRIADEKGKVVVVNIFASWCPPCREEVPNLIALRAEFPENEVVFLGISVDKTPKALSSFMNNYEFNYPVFLAQGRFEQTIGVTAIPQLLIYDRNGALVVNHKGLVDKDDLAGAIREITAGR